MSRQAVAQPQPAQPTYEGDQKFVALNMKADRSELPAGFYAAAVNKRAARGVVETRPGTITPKFANVVAFGAILGSGIYSNPTGAEVILIATPSVVYQIQSGTYPVTIPIPAGTTLTSPIEFVQAFDKVLMFRGTANTPLEWDGKAPAGFTPVTKSDPFDTSTVLIPNAETAVSFQSRLLIPIPPSVAVDPALHASGDGTDIAVSDILDYTSFDAILNNFRANLGTSDRIVRLFPYAQGSMIVGKTHSILLMTKFTDPSHPEYVGMEVLNANLGTCARRSWAMVGGDVFFLSKPGGVYSVAQVVTDRLAASPVPVSDPIAPLIARINWAAVDGAVAAVDGYYYYLAVPLDDSTVNNAVLVYNTVTKGWEGYDTWNVAGGMQIDNLLITDYFGERSLYAINHFSRSIHVLYKGKEDELPGGVFAVSDLLETRGYTTLGWNANTRRDFKRIDIPIATWNPSITVTELTDRASDERLLTATPITYNPAANDIWGVPDFDLTNVNNDFDAVGRQDYAVFTADDPFGVYLQSGINFERKQSHVLRFSTAARGRYVSYRIENAQGQCDILSTISESDGVARTIRRAA